MIKNYLLGIAALSLLTAGSAVAQNKVTLKWDNPGSVVLIPENINNTPIAIDKSATEYVFNGSGTLYILTPAGYTLTDARLEGSAKSQSTSATSMTDNYSSQCSPYISSSYNGKTFIIKTEKVDNDMSLPIDVENGAQYVRAEFNAQWYDAQNVRHGYKTIVPLKNGENQAPYSSKYSNNLTISLIKGGSADAIYSVKKNGTVVNGSFNNFSIGKLAADDKVSVRVFENDEVAVENCILTFDIPEDLKDCIMNIRDWKKSAFVTPTDGKLEVIKGSEIQVNFNKDYTFTKFMLGDKDITDTYKESNNSIKFKVEDNTTFSVAGTLTTYEDVEFTAYVMNPEGILISTGQYGSVKNAITSVNYATEITNGMTGNIQLPETVINSKDGSSMKITGALMTPENTKVYRIKISSKNPNIYFAPVTGYFVKAVWNSSRTEPLGYVTYAADQKTVYVVAQKLDNSCAANVILNGDKPIFFQPSQAFSMMWDNRPNTFGLIQGKQQIHFDAEYDCPFTLRPNPAFAKFAAYLDGMQLSPDDNGLYAVNFYTGRTDISVEEGEDINKEEPLTRAETENAPAKMSTLTIFADGVSSGKTGSVKVVTSDGKTAECYYSELMHKAPTNSFTVLQDTPVTVEPKGEKMCVVLNDELLYGYEGDKLVNKLTDGKYTFIVGYNKTYKFEVSKDLNAPETSAVEEIGAAAKADGKIYNIHGIYVGEELDALPAGLYIRNGKKIIKK